MQLVTGENGGKDRGRTIDRSPTVSLIEKTKRDRTWRKEIIRDIFLWARRAVKRGKHREKGKKSFNSMSTDVAANARSGRRDFGFRGSVCVCARARVCVCVCVRVPCRRRSFASSSCFQRILAEKEKK